MTQPNPTPETGRAQDAVWWKPWTDWLAYDMTGNYSVRKSFAAGFSAGLAHAATAESERVTKMEALLREIGKTHWPEFASFDMDIWRDWQSRIAALFPKEETP